MQKSIHFKWMCGLSSVKRAECVLVRERKCGAIATCSTAGNWTMFAEGLTILHKIVSCVYISKVCAANVWKPDVDPQTYCEKRDSVPESCPGHPHYTSHPPLPHTCTHTQ